MVEQKNKSKDLKEEIGENKMEDNKCKCGCDCECCKDCEKCSAE